MKRTETALDCLVKVASVGSAALMLSSAQAAGQPLETPAGTYEIRICKTACVAGEDEGVVVKGHVVLFSAVLDKQEIARIPSASLRYVPNNAPNACFVLEKMSGRDYKGYAGIDESGFTAWSVTDDQPKLSLFRSPDAGYQVSLRPTTKGFEGEGTSWGAGVAAPPERGPDFVVLQNVGKSDIRRCAAGSRTAA